MCAIVCARVHVCVRACDVRECACVVECMLAHAYAADPAVPQADVGLQHKGGWFWYSGYWRCLQLAKTVMLPTMNSSAPMLM